MSWSSVKNKNVPLSARNPLTVSTAVPPVAAQPEHLSIAMLIGQAILIGKFVSRLSAGGLAFLAYSALAAQVEADLLASQIATSTERKAKVRALVRDACIMINSLKPN